MPGITKLPQSLGTFNPIRWNGTDEARLALTKGTSSNNLHDYDVNYIYLTTTGVMYVLKGFDTEHNNAPIWQGVSAAGLDGGISISTVSGLQDALDAKLTTANLVGDNAAISVTTDNGTTTVAARAATDSVSGVVQLASATDITTGTATDRVVTVAQLQAVKDGALVKTDLEAGTGTGVSVVADTNSNTVTISGTDATDAAKGVVRLATSQEFATGTSTSLVPTVEEVSTALSNKLDKDFSSFTEASSGADSLLLAVQDGANGNKKIAASTLKSYILNEIQEAEKFKGYYLTETALTTDNPVDLTTDPENPVEPEGGSFAIVGSTDSVWVYDTDTHAWVDTKVSGVVDASTQVIAGTGLTGGGSLASDVTLNVTYGTTAGTACEGNDERLSRTPVIWTGTESALTTELSDPESTVADKEGYFFLIRGTASDDFTYKLQLLTDAANQTFTTVSEVKTEKAYRIDQTILAGADEIDLGTVIDSNTFVDVYLSGLHQSNSAYTVVNAANSNTVIELAEAVAQDMPVSVVIYPLLREL
jgi:hypothetical protein